MVFVLSGAGRAKAGAGSPTWSRPPRAINHRGRKGMMGKAAIRHLSHDAPEALWRLAHQRQDRAQDACVNDGNRHQDLDEDSHQSHSSFQIKVQARGKADLKGKRPSVTLGRWQKQSRRQPTLPRSYPRSTIGPGGLNYRVRDGNGCGPSGMIAGKLVGCQSSVFGCRFN